MGSAGSGVSTPSSAARSRSAAARPSSAPGEGDARQAGRGDRGRGQVVEPGDRQRRRDGDAALGGDPEDPVRQCVGGCDDGRDPVSEPRVDDLPDDGRGGVDRQVRMCCHGRRRDAGGGGRPLEQRAADRERRRA
ncbi:hypothetical protein DEJ36_11605 [Curtobacterium sp. MCPF17_052]|nr:hypothetical protein [Curtobacterium sp. MCPF17_052]WIB11601.1 hypothetical protein DEJ36_11605 [Curtobacterium sp. MCPF17_052]